MKIIASTSNKDKIKEIKAKLSSNYQILSKDEAGYEDLDVDETGQTLSENALLKAQALYDLTKEATFADDTGLFVEALGGMPGVYSARYAGEGCSYEDNVNKMLEELKAFPKEEDRKAYFETVICFIDKAGDTHYVSGKLPGHISLERRGTEGFGYDPIFVPDLGTRSLAEMDLEEKNTISHRGRALDALKDLLDQLS